MCLDAFQTVSENPKKSRYWALQTIIIESGKQCGSLDKGWRAWAPGGGGWTVGVWLGKVCWMRSVGKVVLPIADIIVSQQWEQAHRTLCPDVDTERWTGLLLCLLHSVASQGPVVILWSCEGPGQKPTDAQGVFSSWGAASQSS